MRSSRLLLLQSSLQTGLMTSVGVDAATRRGGACSAEDATYTYPRDMGWTRHPSVRDSVNCLRQTRRSINRRNGGLKSTVGCPSPSLVQIGSRHGIRLSAGYLSVWRGWLKSKDGFQNVGGTPKK